MTFKVGDRVRATRVPLVVEGTIESVNGQAVVLVDSMTIEGPPVAFGGLFPFDHFSFEVLTPEPSMGSIVVDREGDAWQRMDWDDGANAGVWKMTGDEGAYAWERLSKTHGPLTVLRHGNGAS